MMIINIVKLREFITENIVKNFTQPISDSTEAVLHMIVSGYDL